MKLFTILFAMMLTSTIMAQEAVWLLDYSQAQEKASTNEQFILLNFSGSDWCGSCIRLEKDLFSTEAFAEFADMNLVLLKADFPAKRANKLSDEQTAHNEQLAEKYNKSGAYPTTILLDSDGNIVAKFAPVCDNVDAYIATINDAIAE